MVEVFGSDAHAMLHMKKFKQRKNGRGAYNMLRNQVLGTDAVTNLSAKAENTLHNLSYNGEQRRFDFDKYIQISVTQHAILQDFGAPWIPRD